MEIALSSIPIWLTQTALGPCGVSYANSKEFDQRVSGQATAENRYHLTGGSVAAQFVWDNRQEESPLERILNAEFTGDRFDRFIVLNGGHGAWKQPNQYIFSDFTRIFLPESSRSTASTSTIGSPLGGDSKSLPVIFPSC